ncbi:5'-AMP-activated protein kinase beta subunit [Pycnococcus provasolii]|uniref:5'-AMP-activated protein kinase beta subunit n=1 Tax=Pycnococcus provasolii TaxID=41880 RepID=A0A830HCT7_9CHLO|nr:5'-AMP-activated protein kinase beta subunit [Pycnococcus provasolii]|mmetsp:Transcript_5618/g.14620  ORF Transcript_5618/g.14620 Transcript_5618/m.14620 type:complete len:328 (-) Transcript_5618:183-1166(-)
MGAAQGRTSGSDTAQVQANNTAAQQRNANAQATLAARNKNAQQQQTQQRNSIGNAPTGGAAGAPGRPTGGSPLTSGQSSPLTYSPQVPMVPNHLSDDFYAYHLAGDADAVFPSPNANFVPTVLSWGLGGNHVAIEGSWDDWTTRAPMQRQGREHTLVKLLPPGVYQYKFVVDGAWRYAPDQPAMYDEQGNVNNVLEVQEYVPEHVENIKSFEQPESPRASYNCAMPVAEDYAKEPPQCPPHLQLTLLNVPAGRDAPNALPRPSHVILSHAFSERPSAPMPGASGTSSSNGLTSMVTLGTTHRYRSKYVTSVFVTTEKRPDTPFVSES